MIPRDNRVEFTLHANVAAHWWLYHLPFAPEAARFRDDTLYRGLVTAVALDIIEFQVSEQVVSDLGNDLNVFLAETVGADVAQCFDDLRTTRLLRVVPSRTYVRSALLTAAIHGIAFTDAIAVALAEDSGSPLLVADQAVFETLKGVELVRPNLRVVWLPDYLNQ